MNRDGTSGRSIRFRFKAICRWVDGDEPSPDAAVFVVYGLTVFLFSFAGVGVGRIGLSLCFAGLLFLRYRRRVSLSFSPVAVWAALYLGWISLAVYWSPESSRPLRDVHKLLPWIQIPLAVTLLRTRRRLRLALLALALGSLVLALRTFFHSGFVLVEAIRDGVGWEWQEAGSRIFRHRNLIDGDGISRLIHAGSMRDAQRLMVGLLAWRMGCGRVHGLQDAAPPGRQGGGAGLRSPVVARAAFWIVAFALGLTFKRGSWFMALFALLGVFVWETLGGWMAKTSRQRPVSAAMVFRRVFVGTGMALGLAGAMLLVYGLEGTRFERRLAPMARRGGRVCMWIQVTPALVRQHPLGIGFKRLTNETMRRIAPRVEPRQNHVHSNPLQSLVDGGWPALIFFLGWMLQALRDASVSVRSSASGTTARHQATALLWMLLALTGVGMVEYQFGTGQMVLLYGFLMGGAAALRGQAASSA